MAKIEIQYKYSSLQLLLLDPSTSKENQNDMALQGK